MKYQLTLTPGFPAPRRSRAGVEVPRGPDGVVVELSDEQLKAIKVDPEITVRKVGTEAAAKKADAKPKAKAAASADDSSVSPPATKQDLLDMAAAEGLELEGLKKK